MSASYTDREVTEYLRQHRTEWGRLKWAALAAKTTAQDTWAIGPPSPFDPGPRMMTGGRSYPAHFDAAAVLRGEL